MITLLAGTSGSGKTYIMEQLIESLGPHRETFPLGPRGALGGYLWPGIAIVGRYTSACGGCDALSWKGGADDIEAKLAELTAAGYRVFLEGLLVGTWGVERLARLTPLGLTVVLLTTPVADCVASIEARRAARAAAAGKALTPFNPANTISKHAGLINVTARRRAAGIRVEEFDRHAALAFVLEAAKT